jgi:hypothetical protein
MAGKEINIERLFCPEKNILQINEDKITTKIVDAELDTLECKFEDGSVCINTEELTYINLTYENLMDLMDLIDQVDTIRKSKYE